MKRLKRKLMRNPLIAALAGMKGNARACLWPEPLWGVPYNLYLPSASLFMAALGRSQFVGNLRRDAFSFS